MFVAVTFTALTANSSAAVYLSGVPRSFATVMLSGGLPNSNGTVMAYVNASGQIGLGAVSANTSVTVSGVYMTN